jgi:hypothetical protein
VIVLRFGPCRMEFSSRLVSTREISVTSMSTGGRLLGSSSRTPYPRGLGAVSLLNSRV